MKNDARLLLNKKKWQNRFTESQRGGKRFAGPPRGPIDARKILNLKRARKILPPKEIFRGSGRFNSSAIPAFKNTFSSINVEPGKNVKLSSDGNIWITAQSKNTRSVPKPKVVPPAFSMSASTSKQVPIPQWEPADVDMDNLEHIGINDVIDMDLLPTALVTPSIQSRSGIGALSKRSLAEVLSMQNTMVADQVESASAFLPARVIVSNLCPSVTNQDIMELFGDVGHIKNSEMTQPGTAVVEFFNSDDASRACHTYHNRLLDGQAMKCFLQASETPQRTSVCQRLGERISIPSSSRPALVSGTSSQLPNPRLRYNPRDVRFTVKLA